MKKGFFLTIACLMLSAQVMAQKLNSVNFFQEGEISKLILDFDQDVFVEKSHLKEDKQIILDLKNVQIEDKYLRGIDTSEFSGATVFVSSYRKPGTERDYRFVIQLRDNVRSILDKKSGKVILSIENRFGVFTRNKLKKAQAQEQLTQDVNSNEKINIPKSNSVEDILENLTMSGVKKYVGKKISINVNNVSYPEVLKMIADTSGFNIIIDNAVTGLKPLTLTLTNIPWDQALDTILDLGDLVAEKYSNILTIKTTDQAFRERQNELDNANKNRAQEPLVTKILPLSFAVPADMTPIIETYLTKGRGSVQIDARTNYLIVKDTVTTIEQIKSLVDVLDTQTPQVLIESKIIEATEEYQFQAGLGGNGLSFSYDPIGSSDLTLPGGIGGGGAALPLPNQAPPPTSFSSFTFSSITDAAVPNVFSASVNVYKRLANLNFSLQLMEQESKVRVVSSPKIITQSNQEATIGTTDTTSFQTIQPGADGQVTGFDEAKVQLELKVTPKVTNEGSIAMKVDIVKGGFGTRPSIGAPPNQTERKINTNVLVDNGSTIVIGGLYQTQTSEVESGIPFLKDIPLIGWLFRSAYNPSRQRNELMVFLTPRIINEEEAGLISKEDNVL